MSGPRQGMAFEMLTKEKILVSYQGPCATQADWDRYLSFMETVAAMSGLRFLVVVEGPPPTAAIQRRITVLVKRQWPVALVSSSIAMRFVVSAFSLINRSIRFFSPTELSDALLHIHCTAADATAVHAALKRLRLED